jgi:ABC-type enterobactin transport system permease subunit
LLAALIMGAASGLLGAIFVEINRHTFQIRKKLVTKNW